MSVYRSTSPVITQKHPSACEDSAWLVDAILRQQPAGIKASDGVAPSSELDWLGDVYSLDTEGRIDDAMDLLFQRMSKLLSSGGPVSCEGVLRAFDVGRVTVDLMIAVLTISLPAKDLIARQRLASRIERNISVCASSRAESLLVGLK